MDTNVVSELVRTKPDAGVLGWLDHLVDAEVGITAVTAAELLYGVERLASGHRRTALAEAIRRMLDHDFDGRVKPFDRAAATHYAEVVANREADGRPIGSADAQIASICRSLSATVATRNVKDFEGTGIAIIDPWSLEPDTPGPPSP